MRYLGKRPDGSVIWDPMEWMYFHPDQPSVPGYHEALGPQGVVERATRTSRQFSNWLLTEYLPANPGSRFLSVHELAKMAEKYLRVRNWQR